MGNVISNGTDATGSGRNITEIGTEISTGDTAENRMGSVTRDDTGINVEQNDSIERKGSSSSRTIRIGLVDNDPYALKVLQTMVERMATDFRVIWTSELGAVAISRCLSPIKRPDVLVTDMSMGDVPGTEVCRAIRTKTPEVGLVGITSYTLESFRDEAVRCGAQALVAKTDLIGIAHAIRCAAEGQPVDTTYGFLDATSAHMLLEDAAYTTRRTQGTGGVSGALSNKERDTLRLYANGCTTKEIATQFGVSTATVATFERRACAKLGARSRAHAISICVRRHEI